MLFWDTFDALLAFFFSFFALAHLCVLLINQPPIYISCSVKQVQNTYSESRQAMDEVKMEHVRAEKFGQR